MLVAKFLRFATAAYRDECLGPWVARLWKLLEARQCGHIFRYLGAYCNLFLVQARLRKPHVARYLGP